MNDKQIEYAKAATARLSDWAHGFLFGVATGGIGAALMLWAAMEPLK